MSDNVGSLDIMVKIKKVRTEAKIPNYATEGSAGLDLSACISEPIIIKSGQRQLIPTGIAVQLPSKYYVTLIFPRSGLGSKYGINLANCVGVIDSDYTGEFQCSIQNNSDVDFEVKPGDRIAQMVFMPIAIANLQIVDELNQTQRGDKGFGSTGVS